MSAWEWEQFFSCYNRSSIASVRKSDAAVKAKADSFKDKDEESSVTPSRRSAIRLKTRAKGPPGLPTGPTALSKGAPGLSNEPAGLSKGAPGLSNEPAGLSKGAPGLLKRVNNEKQSKNKTSNNTVEEIKKVM